MSGITLAPGMPGFLDRSRTVAKAGYNRWLVPPAALAIHLCIGMIYGFSVFWLPLSHALGASAPAGACARQSLGDALFTTACNWRIADLSWTFTLAIVFLGSSAAVFGAWVERAGPRKAGLVAALCWCGGLLIAGAAIELHQLWLLWLGAGVVGGIGLGIGYITPVSTLIKWFPDRRGMATGLAIMGFGGGALVGSPLAVLLMAHFRAGDAPGVWQTFVVLAAIYAVFMPAGALAFRVAPDGWAPAGLAASPKGGALARASVDVRDAPRTPQFWLVWLVLCMNVSAGIGVLAIASPMLQEIFGGNLIGQPGLGFAALNAPQHAQLAAIAAGFVSLLSLFNIGGRIFWASFSDPIGRKLTFLIFFVLGMALYALAPTLAHTGQRAVFVIALCVILSMYGGGFATVPAYLADLFGTSYVGAIHGRLLTAWSVAGVVGPLLVTYIREVQLAAGVSRALAYDVTMYVLTGLLAVGLLANLLVRPVAQHWFGRRGGAASVAGATAPNDYGIGRGRFSSFVPLAWAGVAIPLLWGMWITLSKALVLLR